MPAKFRRQTSAEVIIGGKRIDGPERCFIVAVEPMHFRWLISTILARGKRADRPLLDHHRGNCLSCVPETRVGVNPTHRNHRVFPGQIRDSQGQCRGNATIWAANFSNGLAVFTPFSASVDTGSRPRKLRGRQHYLLGSRLGSRSSLSTRSSLSSRCS